LVYALCRVIYTYVPETNHVLREHCVAIILIFCRMLPAIHIAPYHLSYFLFCPSSSLFYSCMFPCILGLMALTVSEWFTLSCLVAVTFLSLKEYFVSRYSWCFHSWSSRIVAVPYYCYHYYYHQITCHIISRNMFRLSSFQANLVRYKNVKNLKLCEL
jgi:hypothetical protein